jgi:nicotinate-nucleotide adenylyltransferase
MIKYVVNNFKATFKNNIPKCYSFIRNRKIGILGGSFNPAHAGHLHISNIAKKYLGLDEIWWLVAPQNRLKSTFEMESFDKRLSYARLITEKFSYIKVLDLEEKNKLYASYQTVSFLNCKTQKAKFVWLIGSDILDSYNKWLYPASIAKRIYVAVISRPGFASSFVNTQKTRLLGKRLKTSKSKFIFNYNKPIWVFIKNKLLAISSTELRKINN